MKYNQNFCCQEMQKLFANWNGPIQYVDWTGAYHFAGRLVYNCPFCSKILCNRLHDSFIAINKELCCGTLEFMTNRSDPHDQFEIFYKPWARRYFFSTTIDCREEGVLYQEWDFNYCIYCGKKLPTSLLEQWIKAVQDETGIIPKIQTQELLDQTLEKLPEEFKTDTWWKKRGL